MNTKLTERLRELKILRKITKSLWSRVYLATSLQPTRVEYPQAMDVSIAAQVSSPLLTSLAVDLDTVEYIPTKNLTAGVRVFHAGKILDVSLDAIETKLLSSF